MPVIKSDRAAGGRFLARRAGIAIVCLAFAALFWYSSGSFLAVALIGISLVVAFIAHERAFRSAYHCPDCGEVTSPPQRVWGASEDEPILFHCSACDIDWDLGFSSERRAD